MDGPEAISFDQLLDRPFFDDLYLSESAGNCQQFVAKLSLLNSLSLGRIVQLLLEFRCFHLWFSD